MREVFDRNNTELDFFSQWVENIKPVTSSNQPFKMRFTSAIARQKKNKQEVEQAAKPVTGQNAGEKGASAPKDDENTPSENKRSEAASENQSSNITPASSPKRKAQGEEDNSSKDVIATTSPKHSLSTIMSSMKKATTWSEMTTTAIKVPTVARIVWLANRGRWLALDQLLDKLCLEEAPKVDLNIEAALLGVCIEFMLFSPLREHSHLKLTLKCP